MKIKYKLKYYWYKFKHFFVKEKKREPQVFIYD